MKKKNRCKMRTEVKGIKKQNGKKWRKPHFSAAASFEGKWVSFNIWPDIRTRNKEVGDFLGIAKRLLGMHTTNALWMLDVFTRLPWRIHAPGDVFTRLPWVGSLYLIVSSDTASNAHGHVSILSIPLRHLDCFSSILIHGLYKILACFWLFYF